MRSRYLGAFGTSLSLHLTVAIVLLWGARVAEDVAQAESIGREPPRLMPARTAPAPKPEPVPAPPERARLAPPPAPLVPADLGIGIDPADASLTFPTFTFDFGKIIARAADLYPFLTRDFVRDPLAPARRQAGGLRNPLAPASAVAHPPLLLDRAVIQTVIDEAWSRRQRWRGFQRIVPLIDRHDPRVGGLPRLLREYTMQNGLQPYDDPDIRDPRLWAQLGLVADHADFLDFVSHYAAAHPSTEATIELLFLMERLAQASADTLLTLMQIEPARDLRWTRAQHPAAYDAVVRIRRHYDQALSARGLTTDDAVREHFAGVRLAILQNVLHTTPDGYRANDARFLVGAIHWRQGRHAEALGVWRLLRSQAGDEYAAAIGELLAVLRDTAGEMPSDASIRRLLETEHGRWLGRSYDRLRHFGYRFNTY